MLKKVSLISFVFYLFVQAGVVAQTKPLKLACIGNSVTAGMGLADPLKDAYPAQLQGLLGNQYVVKNFGYSGATLLKKGHNPYYKTTQFADAISFKPDIVIIHLGLNDTDPRNWPNYKNEFEADFSWLLDTLKKNNPTVQLFICRLTPIFNEHPRFKSGTRDWYWQIQACIPRIAKANHIDIIDLHEKLYHRPDLFPDAIHPLREGAAIIAQTVYEKITQYFGGLKLPVFFTDNMVLQRKKPIVIFGTANGGDKVTILFHHQQVLATANQMGQWKVVFPALIAGGPYQLKVFTEKQTIEIKNILMGDVWFCSGQSNMAFPLINSWKGAEEITKAANNTTLRLFNFKSLRETDSSPWDSAVLRKTNQLDFFSGSWAVCDSTSAAAFSAIAYYFGKEIAREQNVPIGLIEVAVGGSPIESWIDRHTLEQDDKVVDLLTNWRKSDFIMPWVRERAAINLKNAINGKQRHPYEPCYNFEAGVAMFTKFPIKGVIWYQGESNAHNIELYEYLFPLMIQNWRNKWGSNFPFYYVQLSALDRPSWSSFRDMQNRLQKKIPNSGMAISMDLGDSLNVHPVKKKEVAERLARLALRNDYHQSINASGPVAVSAIIKHQKLLLRFSFAKQLATSDKMDVRGFELINDKGLSIETKATILHDKILVSIPPGEKIISVVYAWKSFTRANLVNESGLPTSTFSMAVKYD